MARSHPAIMAAREPEKAVFLLIAVAFLVRIGFAAALGLGVDESYMVTAGRPFSLGYFDHPPAAWWLQWGAAHLFATEAPLAVRLPFIALFAVTTWLMFCLGRAVAGPRAGLWAALALNLSPVFGVTTGTWVLPDGPLDCALVGAALCLLRAVQARGFAWWAGAGLCAGLALFSKYTAALTILGGFAYLLCAPDARRWLARPEPYVAALIAGLVFAPVVAWNALHYWASFAFQGDRAEGLRFHPAQPVIVLAGEALFVLPWIWAGMAVAVWEALSRPAYAGRSPVKSGACSLPQAGDVTRTVHLSRWAGEIAARSAAGEGLTGHLSRCAGEGAARSAAGEGLLIFLAAPPIIVFALIALWSGGRVLFHWAAPGYLMLFPVLGAWLADRPRLARKAVTATAAFVLLGVGIVATGVRFDWLHPAFAALHARDPVIEAVDWTSVRTDLMQRGLLPPGTIVGVPDWREAGKIAYALGPGVAVTVLNHDSRQFGFADPASAFIGRDMLVLAPEHANRVQQELGRDFAELHALPPARIAHAGRTIGRVAVFAGTGFGGLR